MHRFLVFLFALLLSNEAIACSCGERGDFESLEKDALYVLEAKITDKSVFRSFTQNQFALAPIVFYKGSPTSTIDVWTRKSTSSCGMDFKLGEDYVIFLFKNENQLSTGRCSVIQRVGYRDYHSEEFGEYIANKQINKD